MGNKRGYRTFDEWNKLGFRIRKGSKATWVDGQPMFSGGQAYIPSIRWAEYDAEPDEYQADCGVGYGVDY